MAKKYGQDYFHGYQMAGKGYLVPRLLWKRGSKLGIEMAAQKRNATHFVVGGIIMDDAVLKKGEGGHSVTASELRYAFRNRERLNGRLLFYERGELTSPPWKSNPALWQVYDNKPIARKERLNFLGALRTSFRRK